MIVKTTLKIIFGFFLCAMIYLKNVKIMHTILHVLKFMKYIQMQYRYGLEKTCYLTRYLLFGCPCKKIRFLVYWLLEESTHKDYLTGVLFRAAAVTRR